MFFSKNFCNRLLLICLTSFANVYANADVIVDNTDSDFTSVGDWPAGTGLAGYYGTNYQYTNQGNGSETATWQYNISTAGDYNVEAQWTAHPNRAANAPYSLYSNGVLVAQVTANQQTNGGQFNLLGTFTLAAGTLEVVLDNSASGFVVADATQVTFTGNASNLPPNGTIDTPTENLTITAGNFVDFTGSYSDPDGDPVQAYLWEFGSGSGVVDSTVEDPGQIQFNNTGTFTVNFTVTDSNSNADPTPSQITVTVDLLGGGMPPNGTIDTPTENLTITAGNFVDFTGSYSDPDGDPVQAYLWEFGSGSGVVDSTVEDPGQIQFNNTGTFTVNFTVTDSNSNADPTPSQITVTVAPPGSGIIVDNTDSDFTSVGDWPAGTGLAGYYGTNYQYTNQGNGSETATWQYNISTAGDYNVEAQWTAHPNRAANAPYSLYSNGVLVAQVTANQQTNGGQLNLLGTFTLAAGTLEVVLDNSASGFVVADATQVTFTGNASNLPPNGTIDTPTENLTITAGNFVDFTGSYSDPDGDPVQAYLWEFGSGSGVVDSTVEDPGQIQFNNTGTFTVNFTVTDSNSNADPTPSQITVTVDLLGGGMPPNGTIDTPTENLTITAGNFVDFTGSYSDPDGDPVQAYLWEFGSGSGVVDSTVEDPGQIQFNNTGTFTVNFTVTDSNSNADPTPSQITVTVAPPGSGIIVDNTDSDFTSVGDWPAGTGLAGYYGTNYQYTNQGNGSETATWQYNISTAGDYNVEAQWTAHPNRAANAPYSLYSNGVLVAQVTANQQTNGGQFNLLGTFTLAAGTLEVVLDNSASGFVVADATQVTFTGNASNLPPNGTIDTPTENLTITAGNFVDFTGSYSDPDGDPVQAYLWEFGSGSGVVDSTVEDPGQIQFNNTGTFTVNFTVTDSNSNADPTPSQITVTVDLLGGGMPPNGTIDTPTENLTITAGNFVDFTGSYSDPDGDPVQAYLWEFGSGSGVVDSTVEDPGQIQFNNTGTFTVNFTVTDSNSNADPTPSQITVTVAPPGISIIVDNTDSDFTSVGDWSAGTGIAGYYGTNYQYTNQGNGSETATWQYNISTAGDYNVEAQWTAHPNRAANAPYSLYSNGVLVAQVTANQQTNGGQLNLLGTFTLAAGTLEIVLDNSASGFVVADAVKVSSSNSLQLTITSPLDNTLVTSTFMPANVIVNNKPPGWGVEFILNNDPATSVIINSPPYEHTFQSLIKSEYEVDVHLVDEFGIRQPEFSKSTEFGVGDYYIAFGDSITFGSNDDISSDNTSNDSRNTGGGYEPILNNLLTIKSGYPQTVVNAGVSGNKSSDALDRLPSVLNGHQEANYVLILLGTNDAYHAQLESGVGLLPGATGYAGSYKDYMQQIISTVAASGKTPILAKVLIVQPTSSEINPLIQEYNTVVDELVLSNAITFAPPDFYALFEGDPSLFADNLHPNGNGYIEIANNWSNIFTY